jgi:hypothetical protein
MSEQSVPLETSQNLQNLSLQNVPLRNRHQVLYQKEPEETFYIFENNIWKKCKNVDSLPYSLTIFQLEDGTEIPTCKDSFRLIKEEDYNNKNIPSQKYIEDEYEWRSKINEKDEIDFKYNNKWIKAEIAWKKSDIIPNVWNINHRKSSWIGYFYYESKKFARSSTYTHKFTEEELSKEKQEEERIEKEIKEREERYDSVLNSLKTFKIINNKLTSWFQTYKPKCILEYYLTLDIRDTLSDEEIKNIIHKDMKFEELTEFLKNLASLTYLNCDGCISNIEENGVKFCTYKKKNYLISTKYDTYYDIYIQLYTSEEIENVFLTISNNKICKGVYNKELNRIEFPDFHKLNPLFTLECFEIHADNLPENAKCFYKAVLLNPFSRMLMFGKNPFAASYMKSQKEYIFIHGWGSVVFIPEDELYLE